MANINVSDLQSVDRIRSQEELLEAVSDSVARAVQARGTALSSRLGEIRLPIWIGLIAFPDAEAR